MPVMEADDFDGVDDAADAHADFDVLKTQRMQWRMSISMKLMTSADGTDGADGAEGADGAGAADACDVSDVDVDCVVCADDVDVDAD